MLLLVDTGVVAYEDLLDGLTRDGVWGLDLQAVFHEQLAGDTLCGVLTDAVRCIGHYNETGNEVVAAAVFETLAGEAGRQLSFGGS